MPRRKLKNLRGRLNDTYIKKHYTVPYSIKNNSRYKHIDEVSLYDGKTLEATMGPMDLNVFPFGATDLFTVPKHMENRVDLVSLKFYETSSLYWVICYMNDISDPMDLPAGTILVIPQISDLREFPNPLS